MAVALAAPLTVIAVTVLASWAMAVRLPLVVMIPSLLASKMPRAFTSLEAVALPTTELAVASKLPTAVPFTRLMPLWPPKMFTSCRPVMSEVEIVAFTASPPRPTLEATTLPPAMIWPLTLPPLGPAVRVVCVAPASTPRMPIPSKLPVAVAVPSVLEAITEI